MQGLGVGNAVEQRERSVGGAGMGVFAGLFPASDSDSEDEQYHHSNHRRDGKPAAAAKKDEAALWSLFPDKDAQVLPESARVSAAAGGRSRKDGASSGVAHRLWPTASEKVAGEPSGWGLKRKSSKNKKKVKGGEERRKKPVPSPLHVEIGDKDADDIEAAGGRTRSPSASRSCSAGVLPDTAASDEFEVTKHDVKTNIGLRHGGVMMW